MSVTFSTEGGSGGGNSRISGRSHGRGVRSGRALAALDLGKHSSSSVAVYSPATCVNSMPTQLFQISFRGPRASIRPLSLVSITGGTQ